MRRVGNIAKEMKERIVNGAVDFLLDPEAPQKTAALVSRAKVIGEKARLIADKIDEDPAKAGMEAASSAIKNYGPMLMEHLAEKLSEKAKSRKR